MRLICETALDRAALSCDEASIRLLLDCGADVNAAVRYSAFKDHEQIVRLLLEHQADVNAADKKGETALTKAALAGHQSIVRLIREH